MASQRPSRVEERQRERRRAILDAAISLFARHGFAETGISDIARAAGVSHGTVFLYFPSKDALFRAAVLEPLEEFADGSLGVMDGEGRPLERIRALVGEQVRGIAAERSYLQMVQAAVAQAQRFGDLAEDVSTVIDRVVYRLSSLVAEGMDAGELAPGSSDAVAASYLAYLNGIGLVILDRENTALWEHLIGQGLRLFAPLKGDRDVE
ncbi:MAG TPA: TetR/AcrR family transcriptional regulator [Chloroflexota bacterium]|nr:TetR/AcrR family transcriptional regulator [Chloroflexota bacterium]